MHKPFGKQFGLYVYKFDARQIDVILVHRYLHVVCNFVGNQVNRSTITNFQRVEYKLIYANLECTYIGNSCGKQKEQCQHKGKKGN